MAYKKNTVGVRDDMDFSPGGRIVGLGDPQRADEPASRGYVDAWAGNLLEMFVELINENPVAAGAYVAAMQQHRISGVL